MVDGIHSFSIRFKDENNDWSSVLTQFFYKVPESYLVQNPKVNQYEYWFNGDYNNRVEQSVTPEQTVVLDQIFQTNTLVDGIHSFSIRFKDENNDWSSVLTQFLYKVPESYFLQNPKVNQYEYWFNADYNNRVEQSLTPEQTVVLDQIFQTNTLVDGIHSFSIRFKDENNDWSSVLTQFFYKVPESYLVQNPGVIQYEYWFNNNYDNKVTDMMTPDQVITFDELIDVSTLNNSIHTFSIRFKDENNDWSSVVTQFFYRNGDNLSVVRDITAYQFWFNDDFENQTTIGVDASALFFVDTFVIPEAYGLGLGTHFINLRFKDNTGLWSSIISEEFEISTLDIPETTLTNVAVYPNPTSGLLHVNLNNYYSYVMVSVIDFNGKTISKEHYRNVNKFDFNLSLPSGFYLLIIESDAKQSVHKIIKR